MYKSHEDNGNNFGWCVDARVILGRTHVKSVAEERKQELQVFLHELLSLAAEIAEVGWTSLYFINSTGARG